jgi:hypothetical protein
MMGKWGRRTTTCGPPSRNRCIVEEHQDKNEAHKELAHFTASFLKRRFRDDSKKYREIVSRHRVTPYLNRGETGLDASEPLPQSAQAAIDGACKEWVHFSLFHAAFWKCARFSLVTQEETLSAHQQGLSGHVGEEASASSPTPKATLSQVHIIRSGSDYEPDEFDGESSDDDGSIIVPPGDVIAQISRDSQLECRANKKKARAQQSKGGHSKAAKAGQDLAKEPVQIIPDAVQKRGRVSAGQVELAKLTHKERHKVAMAVAEEKGKTLGKIMESTATMRTDGLKEVVEMQMKGKMDALEREYALKREMEQASREHETIKRLMMMYAQAGKSPGSAYKAAEAAVRPERHEPEYHSMNCCSSSV